MIAAAGVDGSVYFVDDNFIGNQKAALELLPHLVEWQRARGYPVRFACEATLNLAKNERVLELMREAGFDTVFCGIETPDAARAARDVEGPEPAPARSWTRCAELNAYGLEVVSGIIIGLDTDDERDRRAHRRIHRGVRIPMLTINILYALPKTPALAAGWPPRGRLCP